MYVLGGVAIVSALALLLLMLSYVNAQGAPLRVAYVTPRDTEVMSYIASYLVPFFAVDLSEKDDVVTLVGFLLVLGVIYINSSLLLVNPLLSLFGFRVWAVVDGDGHEYQLISRRPPPLGKVIRPTKVGDYLRVQVSWHPTDPPPTQTPGPRSTT